MAVVGYLWKIFTVIESSEGLILLLIRNKVYPTFDSKKDVKQAKKFMKPDYNEYLKKINNFNN